ncbi:MAG: putative bifunctional diguanylate cyclase/phosphodiesterase [Janthinobacterium lividum]
MTSNTRALYTAEPLFPGAALAIQLRAAKGLDEVLGPAVGDGILELGFQRIQSALRRQDQAQPAGRGEISILLPETVSLETVEHLAQRLVDLVQRAYVLQGQVFFLQAFVGIALPSATGTNQEVLRTQAATALKFAALEEAGMVTCFNDDMLKRVTARQVLVADLRKALPLRQLEVHYQPQVSLPSRKLIGFEALLRWNHPRVGWISPEKFIPLAEEIGIISNIGIWVLRTACKQLMSLPETLRMAVNVSPLQLKHGAFCDAVAETLSASGLLPSRLELEITEGILLERSGFVQSALDSLHGMGVRLAIDDFGTGYSSLGQLGHLPFDTIKIDRSLVGTGARNRTIVRAIAMLGDGLSMATLIEGIENEEELAKACEDGCDSAQGYLFGRPIPAHQLHDIISRLGSL